MGNWREDVEVQLRARNNTQTAPFSGVYASCEYLLCAIDLRFTPPCPDLSLWREYLREQSQASELRNQMLIVQHEAQEAISAGDRYTSANFT